MANRNLLGTARGNNHLRAILRIHMETAEGTGPVPQVGQRNVQEMKNLGRKRNVYSSSMLRTGNRLIYAGILAVLCGTAFGQQNPLLTPPEEVGGVFRSDIRLVVCHTTVTDKGGHLVTDLLQTALQHR